jgi:ribosomal protein S18 acetylase RimI-like enzyme
MISRNKVRIIQETLLNSWPAKEYFFLNGWVLRFTDGVTSRANSVLPLNYYGNKKTVDGDIDIVENAYKNYGIPSIFTMHDYHQPKYLRKKLISKGYQEVSPTTTMGASITEISYLNLNNDFNYEIHNHRIKEFSQFSAKYSKRSLEHQKVIEEICMRINIPQKRFVLVKDGTEVIGTTMAVLNVNNLLYIADVLVHPNYRRNRIASSMLTKIIEDWALKNGIFKIWLQVENENENALAFYDNIGLKRLFNYYYLQNSLND